MKDESRIIKLSFHIIKTHSEWHCPNLAGENIKKYVLFSISRAPTKKRDRLLLYNF